MSYVQEIYEVHRDFQQDLIKACSQYSSLRLPDVFLNRKDKFLIYANYLNNLGTAQIRIKDICSQNEFIDREVNVRLIVLKLFTFNNLYICIFTYIYF